MEQRQVRDCSREGTGKKIMYSMVYSATIVGLEAVIVSVETDVGAGLPCFEMSGYLAAQVLEAKERVRVALKNAGTPLKPQRVMVNISPAKIRKAGSGFDLPIAVGILAANQYIDQAALKDVMIIGELSLDGSINAVNGILPSVLAAREMGFKRAIIPADNLSEGACIEDIEVLGAAALSMVTDYLKGKKEALLHEADCTRSDCFCGRTDGSEDGGSYGMDYSDIVGQFAAKRATMVAAAGMHNLIYVGAPGSGKTMLAKRIPTIMPELTEQESLTLMKIYSVVGKLDHSHPLVLKRPFCSPHHTITAAALLGGGRIPKPGELTLATYGVLFLDEFTEYAPKVMEALRQPLEDGKISISRLCQEYTYPAQCMLVAAMNPCKCGYYPDRSKCCCNEQEIQRFLGRISRPLWDRFDLSVRIERVGLDNIGKHVCADDEMTSDRMKKRVCAARKIQAHRFSGREILYNSQMNAGDIAEFCALESREKYLMEQAYDKLGMTMRGYHKVLKTARTIADMEGEEKIRACHLSEAISYKSYVDR